MTSFVRFLLVAALTSLPLASFAQDKSPGPKVPEGLVLMQDIEYGKAGDESLTLHLAMPEKLDKAAPCIVVIHGGAWRAGNKSQHIPQIFDFAKRGYVSVSVGYRFCPKHPFPAQVEDAKCAVRYLRANAEKYHIDPARFGAVGFSAGAHLSMMLGLRGSCQTIIGTRTSGLDALRLATLRIRTGEWSRAIVGAAEEYDTLVNSAYRHCGLYAGSDSAAPFTSATGFVASAAAVTFVVESRASIENRGGKPIARIDHVCSGRSNVLAEITVPQVISSANATRIDQQEFAAIRTTHPDAAISSLYPRTAETFSAGPLLSIAAGALGRQSSMKDFAVLCSDYTGVSAACRISLI